MMLQLVQSPSERIQRLIKSKCGDRDSEVLGTVGSTSLTRRGNDEERGDHPGDSRTQETNASESRVVEMSSVVGSRSDPSDRKRDILHLEEVVDRRNDASVLVASSYSSSSDNEPSGGRDNDDGYNDDDDSKEED